MIEAVISDSDGTLVDSVNLIRHGQYETAITFLTQHGITSSDIPAYPQYESLLNQLVGGSAKQTLERTGKSLYKEKTHNLQGIDYDDLNAMLDPIQDRIAPKYVRSYKGLAETLGKIGEAGVRLAIFSSGTPHHIIRNIGLALRPQIGDFADLYLDKSIDDSHKLVMFIKKLEETFLIPKLVVISANDVGDRTKPDPLSVNLALERLGVSPDKALVIGDHSYDMRAGLAAGITTRVGITHGFDDKDVLLSSGATQVIDSLRELVPLLQGSVS